MDKYPDSKVHVTNMGPQVSPTLAQWFCYEGIRLKILVRHIRRICKAVLLQYIPRNMHTVFALLCFVVVIHWLIFPYPSGLLALWQSNDFPSASKATLMNMDKYFMWIHYERLRNHNKAKHNKTLCIYLGIYCKLSFNFCCWWIITFQTFM